MVLRHHCKVSPSHPHQSPVRSRHCATANSGIITFSHYDVAVGGRLLVGSSSIAVSLWHYQSGE